MLICSQSLSINLAVNCFSFDLFHSFSRRFFMAYFAVLEIDLCWRPYEQCPVLVYLVVLWSFMRYLLLLSTFTCMKYLPQGIKRIKINKSSFSEFAIHKYFKNKIEIIVSTLRRFVANIVPSYDRYFDNSRKILKIQWGL